MKLSKQQREKIYQTFGGRCAYCGDNLTKSWNADHIKPVVRIENILKNPENDTLENIFPSCKSCNTIKNSFSLEEFRTNIKNFINSLNLYNIQYKFSKRYGLVQETNKDVIFFFETFKRRVKVIEGVDIVLKEQILKKDSNNNYVWIDVNEE